MIATTDTRDYLLRVGDYESTTVMSCTVTVQHSYEDYASEECDRFLMKQIIIKNKINQVMMGRNLRPLVAQVVRKLFDHKIQRR